MDFLRHIAVATKIGADEVDIPRIGSGALLNGVLGTVYWVAGVVAVIVIIIAGIFYAISEGDAAKIKRAKDAILYAVVGLAVVMMAFVITNFVVGRF